MVLKQNGTMKHYGIETIWKYVDNLWYWEHFNENKFFVNAIINVLLYCKIFKISYAISQTYYYYFLQLFTFAKTKPSLIHTLELFSQPIATYFTHTSTKAFDTICNYVINKNTLQWFLQHLNTKLQSLWITFEKTHVHI